MVLARKRARMMIEGEVGDVELTLTERMFIS